MPILLEDKNRLAQMQERYGWEVKTGYIDVNLPISTIMTMMHKDYQKDVQTLECKGLVYGSNKYAGKALHKLDSKFAKLLKLMLHDKSISKHKWTDGRSVYDFAKNEWEHNNGYKVSYRLNMREPKKYKKTGWLDMIFTGHESDDGTEHQHRSELDLWRLWNYSAFSENLKVQKLLGEMIREKTSVNNSLLNNF